MRRIIVCWLFLILWWPKLSMSQSSVRDSSIKMFMIAPSFGMQYPLGDMADRFGINSNIGLSVTYKKQNNWVFEAAGSFIFGNKIKQEGLFSHLVNSQGEITGIDGSYAQILVYERGYYATMSVGRTFPVKKPNPNCGFFVNAGAGYIRHKIRVEDRNNKVPALQDDYLKGYDRLTAGFCLRQTAGYIYISNHRLINFFGAIEAVEGLTKGKRAFNFDEERKDDSNRSDILIGFKIGWILPLYKSAPEKYYLN